MTLNGCSALSSACASPAAPPCFIGRDAPLQTGGVPLQVPQYVLDAAIRDGRGAECSIVCTQPRRISAVGVAARVAQVPRLGWFAIFNATDLLQDPVLLLCG